MASRACVTSPTSRSRWGANCAGIRRRRSSSPTTRRTPYAGSGRCANRGRWRDEGAREVIGADHILLGLLREGDGSAARVLKRLGIDAKDCRQQILRELDPNGPSAGPERKGSGMGQEAAVGRVPVDTIDTSKRYDVYCREGGRELVVYRNVLFKGRRWLLSPPKRDPYAEFLELELSNGQTVYLSPLAIGRFCEHGGETDAEEES
ncbi:MAG: Clp protease N-terminal domain-containing protein [Verrucomicrobiae bacterium]|nr:Clp protease N-terminal domain-containing protein [Verrucomicrobiae bacterium]